MRFCFITKWCWSGFWEIEFIRKNGEKGVAVKEGRSSLEKSMGSNEGSVRVHASI